MQELILHEKNKEKEIDIYQSSYFFSKALFSSKFFKILLFNLKIYKIRELNIKYLVMFFINSCL